MKLNHSIYFFFCFLFLKHCWKFFHSILLFFILFGLQTCIKESFMHPSQLLFKTLHKTSKFQGKCIFQWFTDLHFKILPFGVYHGATPWSHWIKQTVKKLNLWGKNGYRPKYLDKSLDYQLYLMIILKLRQFHSLLLI